MYQSRFTTRMRNPSTLPAALLLLLLAMAATLLDAEAADVTELRSVEHFERFATHHKPQLNKVLFFSKLGSSSLCNKLAEEFAGRLDFAVVSKKDNSGLEERFGVDEFPALRVVLASRGAAELDVVAYEGTFKFGAFDDISAWLESQDLSATVPGAVQLLPGDELTEHCGGSTPCIILLTDGGNAKHDALVLEIAAAYAGDVVATLQLDATAWPAAADALGISSEKPKSKKKQKKKNKKKGSVTSGAGTAVFIGPFKNDRGDDLFLHRVLQQAKQFTADGVQRFVRSSMSLAAESVESGEAAEGLTALRRLPSLSGGNLDDQENNVLADEEDEEERNDQRVNEVGASTPRTKKVQTDASESASEMQSKKKKAAPGTGTSGDSDNGGVVRITAKAVEKAASSTPLFLLLVSAKDHSPACTAAESLLLETADVYANSIDVNDADASAMRVEFGLVSLTAKKKGTVEADLERLGLRMDQLPAYRWYRNGEPWDWEPPFPHTPAAIIDEIKVQADPDFAPVADPIVVIEDGDVQTAVAQESLTIVAFIEPETKAAAQLLPELVKAGRVLSRTGMANGAGVPRPPVKLMIVDATMHPAAGEGFGVKKLPWMLLFENGASVGDVSVSGPRRYITEAIVNLVWERQEGPSSLIVSAEDGMDRINSNRRPVHMVGVLGLFGAGDEDSAGFRCFARVAKGLREHLLFMHSFDPELRRSSAWETKHDFPLGSIVILQAKPFRSKYESPAVVTSLYDAMHDADAQNVADDSRDQAIRDWVLKSISVRVGQLTPKTWDFVYKHSLPLVLGLLPVDLYGEGAATTQFWRQRLLKASMHPSIVNESLSYAIADSREYAKLGLVKAAGFADSTAEMSVVILGPAKGQEEDGTQPQIYPLSTDDDVSEKQLRRFVADFLEGKIDPIVAGGQTKHGRKNGGKKKGHGQQMPVSGVPSPAPVSGVPSPAPPVSGVPSPAPPVSGVPSPAPRAADEL